eukprot:Skav206126  [mRNA]  locus=scaffold172:287115:287726:- [translate_table: standard]
MIRGVWRPAEFRVQHDANEFVTVLLKQLQPTCFDLTWKPSVVHRGDCTDTHLRDEHGACFEPLQINIVEMGVSECSVTDLMHSWSDPEGLQRALLQPSPGLMLNINRGHESGMNHTIVTFDVLHLDVPVFHPQTSEIYLHRYEIKAVVIHQGRSLTSGHYRTFIRGDDTWFYYDDGRLPSQHADVTLQPLDHVVQLWATRMDP